MNKKLSIIVLFIILVILGGCGASPKAIEGAERDAVLAFSEPIVDNMLAALNSNDYQAFIKDYDETMLKATTPENYAQLHALISSKLGNYMSREITGVTAVGDKAILVIYSATFENEEGVTIRIIFQPGGDHLVTGLWFDSPKLRE